MATITEKTIKRLRHTFLGASEADCREDLLQLREDPDGHLSPAITERFLDRQLDEEGDALTLRHLNRCGYCRASLQLYLELSDAAPSHPVYALLKQAAQWDGLAAAGRRATRVARQSSLEKGVSPVYQKDGVLVEELPGGETRPYPPRSEPA